MNFSGAAVGGISRFLFDEHKIILFHRLPDHNKQESHNIKKLSICVVNYKTPRLVIDCLASFLPEMTDDTIAVIVDSNSDDGSVEVIGAWLKVNAPSIHCKLVKLEVNGGFSAGYNAAMKAVQANYYLLLNSDTIVRPRAIRLLLEAAERNPEAGLFGPRLEWPDEKPQESCFRDHSPISELISAARTRQVTAALPRYVTSIPIDITEVRPQWISFAAVLVREDVLTTIGLLDEGFFLYYEDSEYCWRARKAKWKILYVPTARVVHLRGGSSQVKARTAAAKRLPRYYYASRTRYFHLRYGLAGPTLANVGWCIGRIISKTRETFGKKKPHLPELAWKDIWTNWSSPLSKNGPSE